MIVADTSAVVAIIKREQEHELFSRIIAAADACLFSAVSYFEASMVIVGRGKTNAAEELDNLISELNILLIPFDQQQAHESRAAFFRFGRGRHPASLNFGDCISYALAKSRDLPLLFKGEDFAKTDIVPASA